MKNYVLFLTMLASSFLFSQNKEKISIHSTILNQDREIWLYTPEEMDANEKYDVIVVFDAQYQTFLDLVQSSIPFRDELNYRESIIVGVVSPYVENEYNRNNDLLPMANDTVELKRRSPYIGNADKVIEFMDKELFPNLEKKYALTKNRLAIGHSNGGTLILYSLLKNPALFTDYIAVSPNFAFDKERLVGEFKHFNFDQLKSKKFIFISQANESEATNFKGWDFAFTNITNVLSTKNSSNLVFKHEAYPKESHFSSFPNGMLQGLREYYNNNNSIPQIIDYIEKNNWINSSKINQIGYNLFYDDRIDEGIRILQIGIKKYPNDVNLYDSLGELYFNKKDIKNASKYYKLFGEKVEQSKSTLSQENYKKYKELYHRRMEEIKKM
ncbi:alpha/beta hydrolase-fold protein [Empedobacter brevis]|uniref:alpha/beta hydrolase-fold protein n=1 Tax=Empedobacter brevis TaxID=247 RepID=UPI0028A5B4FF|nr:alpha/beta hydrolase-fold protein [Empedobacter brevis]